MELQLLNADLMQTKKKPQKHLFYERNAGFCRKYLVCEKSSETGETTLASGAWVLLKMQFSFITYCIFTPTTTAENLRNTWLNEANPCRGLADISNILLRWSQRESLDYWQSCRQRWNLKQQTALVSCKVKICKCTRHMLLNWHLKDINELQLIICTNFQLLTLYVDSSYPKCKS